MKGDTTTTAAMYHLNGANKMIELWSLAEKSNLNIRHIIPISGRAEQELAGVVWGRQHTKKKTIRQKNILIKCEAVVKRTGEVHSYPNSFPWAWFSSLRLYSAYSRLACSLQSVWTKFAEAELRGGGGWPRYFLYKRWTRWTPFNKELYMAGSAMLLRCCLMPKAMETSHQMLMITCDFSFECRQLPCHLKTAQCVIDN